MTVRHLRIDNRLIHGQVTVAWAGNLGANRLVVSNDEVAADEMQRMILPRRPAASRRRSWASRRRSTTARATRPRARRSS